MQSLLLNDVPRAGLAIGYLQHLAVAGVMLLVQLALAATLSVKLTSVAFVIMLAGSLLAVRWTRRGVHSGLALVQSTEDSTSSGIRLHSGLKAALAQGTVPQFLAEYGSSLEGIKREVVRFARDVAAARTLTFFASAVAAALLLFVGVRLLSLPFPVLVTSLVLFARMAGPAQLLQQSARPGGLRTIVRGGRAAAWQARTRQRLRNGRASRSNGPNSRSTGCAWNMVRG